MLPMSDPPSLPTLRERARRFRPEVRERNRETTRIRTRRWRKSGGATLRAHETAYMRERRECRRSWTQYIRERGDEPTEERLKKLCKADREKKQQMEMEMARRRQESTPPPRDLCHVTGHICYRCDAYCELADEQGLPSPLRKAKL